MIYISIMKSKILLGTYLVHGVENFINKNFFSWDHPPANNKSEIFVTLDFAVDTPALCRLCPWECSTFTLAVFKDSLIYLWFFDSLVLLYETFVGNW